MTKSRSIGMMLICHPLLFVQDFSTTFDSLTDSERFDLASEILKRTAYLDFPPLSDEDLVLNAEEIFLQLD
jgi:hypothetical protein